MNDGSDIYRGKDGEAYLAQRQSSLSDHVQGLRASLFQDLGDENLTILDFGCGSGGLLSRLKASRKIGVEIGESAAALAREAGIEVVPDIAEITDRSVDVVISFHAIEHVDRPIDVLQEIGRVTKTNGKIRLIVPGEIATHPRQRVWRANPDRHLHTWTPLLFGNLAEHCGYRDIETRVEPMPTKSRKVRALSAIPPLARAVHWRLALRDNRLNVVLNAKPPA